MSILQCPTLTRRVNIFSFIVAIAFAKSPNAHAADAIERSVTGEWRFTAALDGAGIAALDENEAKKLLGQVFVIRKDKVRFQDFDCGETEFAAQKVAPALHVREEFHASANKLGLPDPVTVVDLSCTSVFVKKQNRLVIFWQGWFFDAVRVKR